MKVINICYSGRLEGSGIEYEKYGKKTSYLIVVICTTISENITFGLILLFVRIFFSKLKMKLKKLRVLYLPNILSRH